MSKINRTNLHYSVPTYNYFKDGGVVRCLNDIFITDEGTRFTYSGELPFTVPSGSTPDTLGGIKSKSNPDGLWLPDYSYTLKDSLAYDGSSWIGFNNGHHSTNIKNLIELNLTTPEMFGAVGDGVVDDYSSIQECIKYCTQNKKIMYLRGIYSISKPLNLTCNVDGLGEIVPSQDFIGTVYVIRVPAGSNDLVIRGLKLSNKYNVSKSGKLKGIEVQAYNITFYHTSVNRFFVGFCLMAFNITLNSCTVWGCNTAVSMYSEGYPPTGMEINSIRLISCNLNTSDEYSVFIGDNRFNSSIPKNEYMGFNISIEACSLDTGTVKLLQVWDTTIKAYFEGFDNDVNKSAIEIGSHDTAPVANTVIQNCSVRKYKHFVECLAPVLGLKVQDCTLHRIEKCGLKIPTLYSSTPIEWLNNTLYGASAGITIPVYGELKEPHRVPYSNLSISDYGISNGVQYTTKEGIPVIAGASVFDSNIRLRKEYTHQYYNRYLTPIEKAVGTGSGLEFTFNNTADFRKFRVGDSLISSSGTRGFCTGINFDKPNTIQCSFDVSTSTTLSQELALPFVTGASWSKPTVRADVGSRVINKNNGTSWTFLGDEWV